LEEHQRNEFIEEIKNMRMIDAIDLVNNPNMKIEGKYRTIRDTSFRGYANNLEKAMNIMAKRGWKLVSVYSVEAAYYAVFEKIAESLDGRDSEK
jgi:hypothetical protein